MHHCPSISNHLSIMFNRHLHPSIFWTSFILPSITPFSILHLPLLHHPFFHLHCSVIHSAISIVPSSILPSSIAPLCRIAPLYPIIAPSSILPSLLLHHSVFPSFITSTFSRPSLLLSRCHLVFLWDNMWAQGGRGVPPEGYLQFGRVGGGCTVWGYFTIRQNGRRKATGILYFFNAQTCSFVCICVGVCELSM